MTSPVVYVADQDAAGVYELYVADADDPGRSVKLNPALVAGGFVDEYHLSPDGKAVAYMADQEMVGRYEIYLVDFAQPGTAVKVNAPLGIDRDVRDFVFSPDGSRIAYRADQDSDDVYELYLVDLDQPGMATRLNAPLTNDGWVRGRYRFSPDGTQLLYRADQDQAGTTELYLVELSAPGVSTRVNPPLAAGGAVSNEFDFTPDGMQIGYVADQAVDDVFELYVVDITQPGTATRLNRALVSGGNVYRFGFSPDSTRAAYFADEEAAGRMELFTVELANPEISTRLNPALVVGGQVTNFFRFSPDGSHVAYIASQDTAGVDEVYMVPISAAGLSVKLSGAMSDGGNAYFFEFSPQGNHLAYVADQEIPQRHDLYGVDLTAPGAATRLSASAAGIGVYDFQYSPDASRVLYMSAQDSDYAELYRVDLAVPGASTRINPALAAGGEVWIFDVVKVD